MTVLALAGIPFAFYADVIEIALPLLLVQNLHAPLAVPSGIFVANTVMVIALQVVVVVRLAKWPHRTVLVWSGLLLAGSYLAFWLGGTTGGVRGTVIVVLAVVPYTLGEILYSGSSVPLVMESAPPHLMGRALARWQLSYGLARAIDPLIITGLLSLGTAALWLPLAAVTLMGAATVRLGARTRRTAARIGGLRRRVRMLRPGNHGRFVESLRRDWKQVAHGPRGCGHQAMIPLRRSEPCPGHLRPVEPLRRWD